MAGKILTDLSVKRTLWMSVEGDTVSIEIQEGRNFMEVLLSREEVEAVCNQLLKREEIV